MSAAGLPLSGDGHIAEHFGNLGLCQCPCDECTLRLTKGCVCMDCPCDPYDGDAPEHGPELPGIVRYAFFPLI